MFENLNPSNFEIYAIKSYDSPNCVRSEFEEDIKRIKYVRKLIKRYKMSGELKDRLILNHIIVLTNVFGVVPAVRMLFYKFPREDYPILKTFLIKLNFMPLRVVGINGKDILSSDIQIDAEVANALREG